MSRVEELCARIGIPSPEVAEQVRARWEKLRLGAGDAGKLQEIVIQYAAAVGSATPSDAKKMMILAAGDHGFPNTVCPHIRYR